MYWDVKIVKPLPDFRIYVEIENGRKGIFDLTPISTTAFFANFGTCIISIGWALFLARSLGPTSGTLPH